MEYKYPLFWPYMSDSIQTAVQSTLKTKMCSKCKETKDVCEFRHRNEPNRRSEYRCHCRSCEKVAYKLWHLKNKEKRKLYKQQEWYKKYNREYSKKYASEHLELRAFHQRQRVVNKKGNGGKFTLKEWKMLKEFYKFTCLKCFKKEPEIKLTQDHVIPLSMGGVNNITNIQPLCWSCNSSKKSNIADYRRKNVLSE